MHKKAIKFIIELHCLKSARNKYHTPSIAPESPCYRPGDSVPSAPFIPPEAEACPCPAWHSVPLPPCNAPATWPLSLLVERKRFAALRWLQRVGHQDCVRSPGHLQGWWVPCVAQSLRAEGWCGHRSPGFWVGAPLVPVQVCLDFMNLIFERALKMLAFKVIYTWQNMAFSLGGKKGIKGTWTQNSSLKQHFDELSINKSETHGFHFL